MLSGGLALGCDESLKAVELVVEPRVLGARVEVLGEASRAAPSPGETASASFLVASPKPSSRSALRSRFAPRRRVRLVVRLAPRSPSHALSATTVEPPWPA
jgi:hypothetical protein